MKYTIWAWQQKPIVERFDALTATDDITKAWLLTDVAQKEHCDNTVEVAVPL